MHWWHLITAFEVSLALILTVRVFVLGIRSVRPMLLFLLVPRILAPISFALLPNVTDYRKVWIVFAAIQWSCHIGIVYAFISAAFYSFDGLLIILRKGWTLAL